MNLQQEHYVEREMDAPLAANGWLHAGGDASHDDSQRDSFLCRLGERKAGV